jgi:hypothetical protein
MLFNMSPFGLSNMRTMPGISKSVIHLDKEYKEKDFVRHILGYSTPFVNLVNEKTVSLDLQQIKDCEGRTS